MAQRPYFQKSTQELETLVNNNTQNEMVLRDVVTELGHRARPKAKALQLRVQKLLLELPTSGNTGDKKPSRPKPSPDKGTDSSEESASTTNGNTLPPDDRRRPGDFTLINPPGVPGRPAKYVFPTRSDFDLPSPRSNTRAGRFVVALEALVEELRKKSSGTRQFIVENGKSVETGIRGYAYSFEFVDEAGLFEDTQVQVVVGGRQSEASIVSISAGRLILDLVDDFGPYIKSAIIRVDNTALLVALKEKLEEFGSKTLPLNVAMADALFEGESPVTSDLEHILTPGFENLNPSQKRAVSEALQRQIFFIWGPPGTGKTHTLAVLIQHLFDTDKRVLICSNTNQAVDQVLLKLCDALGKDHPALDKGRILRVGNVSHPRLKDEYQEYAILDGIVARCSVDLEKKRKQLKQTLLTHGNILAKLRAKLQQFEALDASVAQQHHSEKELEQATRLHDQTLSDLESARRREASCVQNLKARQDAGTIRRVFMKSEEALRAKQRVANTRTTQLVQDVDRNGRQRASVTESLKSVRTNTESIQKKLARQNRRVLESRVQALEADILPIKTELREVERQLDELAKSIMADAKVIGATVTRGYLTSKDLGIFDVVIIDEASMVMLPALYFVAGMARERVVVSGDFSQLPPIVQSNQEAILEVIGKDIFREVGITESVKRRVPDSRIVLLETQYRMAEPICHLISGPMYNGRLQTDDKELNRPGTILPPSLFSGALTIVDTSKLWPFENRNALKSRFNLMHALIVRNLAWYLGKSGYVRDKKSVGICSPYSAQSKLTQRLLKDEGMSEYVDVGTVHRYQGDQKAIMVVDFPESIGSGWNIGMFLQGDSPDDAGSQLLNVAVSRAQDHLIIIANLTYLDEKLPSNAILRGILHEMQTRGTVVEGQDVLDLRTISEDLRRYGQKFDFNWEENEASLVGQSAFEAVCMEDLRSAKTSIAIFSGFFTPQRIAAYGDLFRSKLEEGVAIRCVTRPPKHNGSMDPSDGAHALDALEALGVVVDERWTIHEKVVLIDDEVVWFGSLNPLSHTARTDEVMARLVSKGMAQQLSAFLSIIPGASPESADGLSTRKENPECPSCGARTCWSRGKFGPFFQCERCNWRASQDAVFKGQGEHGLDKFEVPKIPPLCPAGHGRMVLRNGGFGPFFGCPAHPQCKKTKNLKRKRRTETRRRSNQ